MAVGFATGFKTALVREHSRFECNRQILRRIPPTASVSKSLLALHRLINGKLAEQWEYEDNWSANIQAGLIDPDKMTFNSPPQRCPY